MATFVMFGKYSAEAIKGISAARTAKANEVVKKNNGSIKSMYALLGENDLVFVIEFPGTEEAMKASIAMNKLTGISFTTSEAIPVDRFDTIMGQL
jgi:uncharacterized protein with GYD domain